MQEADTADAGSQGAVSMDAGAPNGPVEPTENPAMDPGGATDPSDAGVASRDAQVTMDAGDMPVDPADEGLSEPGAEDWPCFGGDLGHSRHAGTETLLDTGTVRTLQLAWRKLVPGMTGTPAVVDGTVYFADWSGGVHAHALSDGAEVWTSRLPRGVTSSLCVTRERVFAGDREARVHALDRATGEVLWTVRVDGHPLAHLYSSPVVVGGIVIVGVAAYGTQENRTPLSADAISMFRGAVVGLDSGTGERLWRFEATRVEGEPDWYGPGVAVWSTAAIDRERGALFVGTGNGYATPVSPYSDALLAIDYRTGALAWHNQFTANDAYSSGNAAGGPDYDVGASPNLFTIDDGGVARDVVGVGDKAGVYRVLDRDSGELIWQQTLEPGLLIALRKTGGIIAPAAYADGRLFVASNTGSASSRVWALDARTGAILWTSASVASVNFGAPAVAGGVVFAGGSGFSVTGTPVTGLGVGGPGRLTAHAADTGAVLRDLALHAGRGGGFSVAGGHVLVGSGFSFFAVADEPLAGALEVFAPADAP